MEWYTYYMGYFHGDFTCVDAQKSYGFGITWGWVSDDILSKTISGKFKAEPFVLIQTPSMALMLCDTLPLVSRLELQPDT